MKNSLVKKVTTLLFVGAVGVLTAGTITTPQTDNEIVTCGILQDVVEGFSC